MAALRFLRGFVEGFGCGWARGQRRRSLSSGNPQLLADGDEVANELLASVKGLAELATRRDDAELLTHLRRLMQAWRHWMDHIDARSIAKGEVR